MFHPCFIHVSVGVPMRSRYVPSDWRWSGRPASCDVPVPKPRCGEKRQLTEDRSATDLRRICWICWIWVTSKSYRPSEPEKQTIRMEKHGVTRLDWHGLARILQGSYWSRSLRSRISRSHLSRMRLHWWKNCQGRHMLGWKGADSQ